MTNEVTVLVYFVLSFGTNFANSSTDAVSVISPVHSAGMIIGLSRNTSNELRPSDGGITFGSISVNDLVHIFSRPFSQYANSTEKLPYVSKVCDTVKPPPDIRYPSLKSQ